MKGILAVSAVCLTCVLAAAPARAVTIVLPRAGQVGVGVQGQFGGLVEAGELGDEFSTGGGMAVRLKYRMRYGRAAGLSFEARSLDGRGHFTSNSAFLVGVGPDSLPLRSLSLQTFGGDVYQFFNIRGRDQVFVSGSAGLAKVSATSGNGDTVYPLGGDGLFVGVGLGFEHFVYRSWAIDTSVRYSSIFLDGTANHDLQAAVGMTFYAAY
jgi:hypothetical protein